MLPKTKYSKGRGRVFIYYKENKSYKKAGWRDRQRDKLIFFFFKKKKKTMCCVYCLVLGCVGGGVLRSGVQCSIEERNTCDMASKHRFFNLPP